MSLKYVFHEKNVLGLKEHFIWLKSDFLTKIPIISNNSENLMKRHLAKIKYAINSGHRKYGSAPFCTILLF